MRRADYLKNLYQLVRLCTELLAKTFILVLLVPLGREREAAAPREERLHAPVGLQRLQRCSGAAAESIPERGTSELRRAESTADRLPTGIRPKRPS